MEFLAVILILWLQRRGQCADLWCRLRVEGRVYRLFDQLSSFSVQQRRGLCLLLVAVVMLSINSLLLQWLGLPAQWLFFGVSLWWSLSAYSPRGHQATSAQDVIYTTYQNTFFILLYALLMGPVGAVVARFWLAFDAEAVADQTQRPSVSALVDWLPVRVMGLSFALMGHFARVLGACVHKLTDCHTPAAVLLFDWAAEAVSPSELNVAVAQRLLSHVLLLWVVVLSLLSLAAWL